MNLILTEFQKLKRYSVILVGMIGATCSPVISIVRGSFSYNIKERWTH